MDETYLIDKPYGIVVDTNILIYLFQPGNVDTKTFNKFLSCIIMNKMKLIIPKQVQIEWERHKSQKNISFQEDIIHSIEKHSKLSDYMRDDREKEIFKEQLNHLKKMATREYNYSYGLRARHVDKILNDPLYTDIIECNDHANALCVDFALNKREPFFSNPDSKKDKNQMADAIIFFTSYENLKTTRNYYHKVYFITENKKDYSPKGNDSILHGNLQPFANEVSLKYINNLNNLLKIVDPKDEYYFSFFTDDSSLYLSDIFFETCFHCSKEVHINADSISPPSPHQSYILKCPHCNYEWDTGNTPEDYYG